MARTRKQNAMDVLMESFTELRKQARKRMTKKQFAQAEKSFEKIIDTLCTTRALKKSRQNEIMMALQVVDAKDRLKRIAEIIEIVDDRCMAADGPVTKTQDEITIEEFREIYKLASQEKRVSTAIKVTVSNSMYMAALPVIGKKFYVHITKGHQHFRLDYDGNKEECEWMAHMLRLALSSGDAGSTQYMLRDAGQLIRRLMHRITKDNPALPRPEILAQADGWLKHHCLQGSILRDTEWRAEEKR